MNTGKTWPKHKHNTKEPSTTTGAKALRLLWEVGPARCQQLASRADSSPTKHNLKTVKLPNLLALTEYEKATQYPSWIYFHRYT
jgi:hypothetical protein